MIAGLYFIIYSNKYSLISALFSRQICIFTIYEQSAYNCIVIVITMQGSLIYASLS
jgi:hypothetical protein